MESLTYEAGERKAEGSHERSVPPYPCPFLVRSTGAGGRPGPRLRPGAYHQAGAATGVVLLPPGGRPHQLSPRGQSPLRGLPSAESPGRLGFADGGRTPRPSAQAVRGQPGAARGNLFLRRGGQWAAAPPPAQPRRPAVRLLPAPRAGPGFVCPGFVAEEVELGGRPVVLKVSAIEGTEPQTLGPVAAQHIVPVYSVHENARLGLRALCMPYFGGSTSRRCCGECGTGGGLSRGDGKVAEQYATEPSKMTEKKTYCLRSAPRRWRDTRAPPNGERVAAALRAPSWSRTATREIVQMLDVFEDSGRARNAPRRRARCT